MFKFSQTKENQQLYVQSLELNQYRNIDHIKLTFPDTLHFFVGPNAQGKTNLLESLYVVALGKSHRTRTHKELIQFGKSMAKVRASMKKRGHSERLEVVISSNGKRVSKNGVEQKKLSQYIGTLPTILFAPEDLAIVQGGPQIRRRFLNMEIGQVSPSYVHDLSIYNQLLQQRNRLLKQDDKYRIDLLEVIEEQIIPLSVRIWKRRIQFLKELNKWACHIHQQITQQEERLELLYQASVPFDLDMKDVEIQQNLKKEILRIRQKEMSRRVTLVGPHRDDVRVQLGKMDVNIFGSQGQQRTVALSLKLAEIEYIHHKMGVFPILLLDDVLSELDDHRKNHLFQAIQGRVQTFVTTTSLDGINSNIVSDAAVYHVRQGTIIEQR